MKMVTFQIVAHHNSGVCDVNKRFKNLGDVGANIRHAVQVAVDYQATEQGWWYPDSGTYIVRRDVLEAIDKLFAAVDAHPQDSHHIIVHVKLDPADPDEEVPKTDDPSRALCIWHNDDGCGFAVAERDGRKEGDPPLTNADCDKYEARWIVFPLAK